MYTKISIQSNSCKIVIKSIKLKNVYPPKGMEFTQHLLGPSKIIYFFYFLTSKQMLISVRYSEFYVVRK